MGAFSLVKTLSKGWKSLISSTTGKAFLGGLGTFFGFEWLTDGGLGESVSGTLGVSETTGNLILIVVICLGIYLVFRYLDSRIPSRSHGNKGAKR